jgi:nucleoside-diphosphate-sugar epimerase
VYGDGEQRRAPSATCRMPVVALVALLDHAGAVGDVVNVGATNESINELARQVIRRPGRLRGSSTCPARTLAASRTWSGGSLTHRRTPR